MQDLELILTCKYSGIEGRRNEIDAVPDSDTRSVRLTPADGSRIMRGAGKRIEWPGAAIEGVKIELVITDSRIAFAIPRIPKPKKEGVHVTFVYWWFYLLMPLQRLLYYAWESYRARKYLGLGHLRYAWISGVGYHLARVHTAKKGDIGDIVSINYMSRPPDNERPTGHEHQVLVELAPDLSGYLLATELARRVCASRLSDGGSVGSASVDSLSSSIEQVKQDLHASPVSTVGNAAYQIPGARAVGS